MKILKIAGVVAGIHAFFLIVIFANPGCSSTTKPAPSPADTMASSQPAPVITVPGMSQSAPAQPGTDTVAPAPVGFNPDAPATYGEASGGGVRFTPTRPNTPAAAAVLQQPVENVTPATTYTVKAGDSLWTLGKKFHIDYKEIAAANNMKVSTALHEGQKLIIPSKSGKGASAKSSATAATSAPAAAASTKASTPAASRSGGEVKYTVKSGETLGGIAHKFGVSVRELAVANSIADPLKLRAGTELTIPGWQEPSGSKAGSSGRSHAASAATSTSKSSPSAGPAQEQPVPATTEPAPAEPTPTQTSTVPVINIDENPVTPAPNS